MLAEVVFTQQYNPLGPEPKVTAARESSYRNGSRRVVMWWVGSERIRVREGGVGILGGVEDSDDANPLVLNVIEKDVRAIADCPERAGQFLGRLSHPGQLAEAVEKCVEPFNIVVALREPPSLNGVDRDVLKVAFGFFG